MSSLYFNLELDSAEVGRTATISGAEARHAVSVNRTRPGERLSIGNGRGLIASGVVIEADASTLAILVDDVAVTARPTVGIWLVQALAKGDRDELAVQAATELGVDGVIPWAAARSVSRWEGAKVAKGQERWAAITREATKQSIRPWLPEVSPLVSTKQLASLASNARLVVLDPTSRASLSGLDLSGASSDLVIVVGPEGGVAPQELEVLYGAGAVGVRLGDTILRTSTAGPAAIAVLNAKLGRW